VRERLGSAGTAEGEADLFFDVDDIVVCGMPDSCCGSAIVQRGLDEK
jgi:hypothetical protein